MPQSSFFSNGDGNPTFPSLSSYRAGEREAAIIPDDPSNLDIDSGLWTLDSGQLDVSILVSKRFLVLGPGGPYVLDYDGRKWPSEVTICMFVCQRNE